jgi:hypothetical protein
VSGEFPEVDRVIGFGEIVVVERIVGNLRDPLELGVKQRIGLVLRYARLRKRGGKLPRPVQPRLRTVDAVDVEAQDFPNRLPHVTAGVDVIADEHDAVRPQPPSCQGEHRVAHPRRNPRVDAVRDHVVEFAQRFRQLTQGSRYKHDGEPQIGGGLPRRRDGARREIAADELAIGQACRHRQQIGSAAAAELEDAAGRDAWRCETEQRGDDGHVIRMRQRVRLPLVRDGVVLLDQRRVGRAIAHAHSRKRRHDSGPPPASMPRMRSQTSIISARSDAIVSAQ